MAEQFPCAGASVVSYPLVLLHGWGFDSRIWVNVIPSLQKKFDVICVDLPGFGNNKFCSADIRVVADHILAQLPAKSILLGWSLGGMVATHLAIQHPQRVAALITVGSNLKWVSDTAAGCRQWPGASADNFAAFFENLTEQFDNTRLHFCNVIARGDHQEKQLARTLRQYLSPTTRENFLAGLRLLDSIDNREGFATLMVPGLHLFGENDVMVPLSVERALRSLNKNQQTGIIAGTAHAPFLTAAETFSTWVCNFVQTLPGPLDKKRVATSFSKAATTYDEAAQLQREVGDRLFSLLPDSNSSIVLDLGCGTGTYSAQLQKKFPLAQVISLDIAPGMLVVAKTKSARSAAVCADAESLPFQNDSIALVFSSLAIQWCQDYRRLFAELYRVLTPGGACVISTFQDGTLKELKTAWKAVDDLTHVNHFHQAHILSDAARQAGFVAVHMQEQRLVQHYATVQELSAELKALGAHNLNAGRPGGLTGKGKFKQLIQAYEPFRTHDKLPAHYEIVFLQLTKE